jgi:hypothetical protein
MYAPQKRLSMIKIAVGAGGVFVIFMGGFFSGERAQVIIKLL